MKVQLFGGILLMGLLTSGCSDATSDSDVSVESESEADIQEEEKTEESNESDVSEDGETEESGESDVSEDGETEESNESDVSEDEKTEESNESDVSEDGETEESNESDVSEDEDGPAVSEEKKDILQKKFDGMENNPFIESITPENDSYSEIVVVVDENAQGMSAEAVRSKMRGMGKSIREATAGVVHDGDGSLLPITTFKNKDNDVIAEYDSRERESDITFH